MKKRKKVYDADLFIVGEYPISANALIKNRRIIKVFRRRSTPERVPDKLPLRGRYGRRWFTNYAFFYDEDGLWFIAGRRLLKVTKDLKFSYKSNPLWFYFRIKKGGKTIYRKFGFHLDFVFLPLYLVEGRDDYENFFERAFRVFSRYDPDSKSSPLTTTYLSWSRQPWV